MQRLRRGTAAGLVAGACLLAVACTPTTGGGPPPTVQPTPTPTPSEDALSRQRRLDFAAAEKAFRTFRAERERLLIAGGAGAPTPILEQTSTGQYLKDVVQLLKDYKQTGGHQTGKEVISYIRQGGYSGTELLLDSCLDGRGITTYIGKKSLGSGNILKVTLTVRKISGAWKVSSASGGRAASCD